MPATLVVAAVAAGLIACADNPDTSLAPSLDEATTDAAGGCPGQFTLAKTIKWSTAWKVQGRDPADDNGDFLHCQLITKEPVFDEKNLVRQGVVVLIDNNIPADKLGKCPLSFTAVATFAAPEDANGNTVICRLQSEEEGLVLVDDNDS
jgi:hypothetical protein